MAETVTPVGWVSAIQDRARDKNIRRQILSNRISREVTRRMPHLLLDYLKMLLGSLLGLWVISILLVYIANAVLLYTLAAFGFLYSMQAAYYKYRLSVDPGFKIPRCQCSGSRSDDAEKVLRSKEGAILRIPNTVVGIVLYTVLPFLVYSGRTEIALLIAIVAVIGSTYLGYVMVVRIRALCVTCISLAAVNVLVLWQLWH
jgi:uncharacterized membrane protein